MIFWRESKTGSQCLPSNMGNNRWLQLETFQLVGRTVSKLQLLYKCEHTRGYNLLPNIATDMWHRVPLQSIVFVTKGVNDCVGGW